MFLLFINDRYQHHINACSKRGGVVKLAVWGIFKKIVEREKTDKLLDMGNVF
jgi:hypothetical protein